MKQVNLESAHTTLIGFTKRAEKTTEESLVATLRWFGYIIRCSLLRIAKSSTAGAIQRKRTLSKYLPST